MESLPTKYPAGRGSTAGMASGMVGPRWKRRSFVDDGIPPEKISCRSRFHRWNGLRHGFATMETKILRGRWNPSQQNTLPVGVPPLEWPPTWLGHDGDEDHSWTMESPSNKIPCWSRFLRWNGLRHGWATMETKILRGRWNPSQLNALPVGVPPLEWLPTWLGHDGDEDHSWTMESLPGKYPAGRGSTAGMASDFNWGFTVFRIWACLTKPFEIKLGLRMSFQGHCFCKKSNIEKAKRCLFVKNHVFRVLENPLLRKCARSCLKNRCKFQDKLKYQQLLQTISSSKKHKNK